MSKIDFSVDNSVIAMYTRSLYNIALKSENEFVVNKQLNILKTAILSITDYKPLLKRFNVMNEEAYKFIQHVSHQFKLLKEIENFLKLLVTNKRFGLLIELCNGYNTLLEEISGKKTFIATFSAEVSDKDLTRLKDELKNVFGGTIDCHVQYDKSIVSGFTLQHRSKIMDCTLKSKINRLRIAMRGANYGN